MEETQKVNALDVVSAGPTEIQVINNGFDLPNPTEVKKRAEATRQALTAVCQCVSVQNIVDFGGKPFFDHIACKRIANTFGLIVRQNEKNGQIDYVKEVIDEATNHYIIHITGKVWHSKSPENYEIYEGTASSFDDFFRSYQIVEKKEEENGKTKQVVVSAHTLPISKVQEKATANLLQRCIKKKLGLDFTWEELESVGIDRSKCRGFSFNSTTTDSAEILVKKQEVWNKIVEICNGNIDLARKTLQKHTAFGNFAGHTDINKVKETQLNFLINTVEKAYKDYLKKVESGENNAEN